MSRVIEMPEITEALAAEAWEWLTENRSDLAAAVEVAVQRGASPRDIQLKVLTEGGFNRSELAHRARLAAVYLTSQNGEK